MNIEKKSKKQEDFDLIIIASRTVVPDFGSFCNFKENFLLAFFLIVDEFNFKKDEPSKLLSLFFDFLTL